VISGFSIEAHMRIDFHLSFFLSASKWAPTVASGPLSAAFPILGETPSYATVASASTFPSSYNLATNLIGGLRKIGGGQFPHLDWMKI